MYVHCKCRILAIRISKSDALTTLPDPSIEAGRPKVEFQLDTDVLAKNSKIYTVNGDEGKMEFCARMSVGYTPKNGNGNFKEVNFIESIITIKYMLKADIDLSKFKVAPKTKDTSAGSKTTYGVIASLCSTSTPTFNQGSLVCVEVYPDVASAKDGIVMKSIESFTWTRGKTTQKAINGGVESGNKLTSLDCTPNSPTCSFESVLFANFYKSSGNVFGNGSATMMFQTGRRTLMGGSASGSGRSLQEAAAAATSEFDIAIPVGASDDGVGALKTAGGASFGFTALASIVGLVSAVLLA